MNTPKLKALPTADFVPPDEAEVKKLSTEQIKKFVETHTFDASKVPEDGDVILYYKEVPLASKTGIITITGKAKSRKTVIASAVASSFFMDPENNFLGFRSMLDPEAKVLHIDTEQGYRHYYESVMRIFRDAGVTVIPDRFTSVHAREADVQLMIELTEYLLGLLKPAVLIIDGVTDFIEDINDQREAKKLTTRIMKWASSYNMVVIAVIHTTKTTGYMTGAIGTALEKKCESSIKVEKDEDNDNLSHVSCHMSRNKSFPDFTIVFDEEKKQYVVMQETDVIKKGKTGDKSPGAYPDDIHQNILNKIFVVRSRYSDFELKIALINNCRDITGDTINAKMSAKWLRFYNERALLFQDPEGGWMRTDISALQTTLFSPRSDDDKNIMPETDDLPF